MFLFYFKSVQSGGMLKSPPQPQFGISENKFSQHNKCLKKPGSCYIITTCLSCLSFILLLLLMSDGWLNAPSVETNSILLSGGVILFWTGKHLICRPKVHSLYLYLYSVIGINNNNMLPWRETVDQGLCTPLPHCSNYHSYYSFHTASTGYLFDFSQRAVGVVYCQGMNL